MRTMLWLDLEATGSDVQFDEIIEIGAVLTDPNLLVCSDPFEAVVQPSMFAYDRMANNEVVREMHVANGLFEECLVAEDSIAVAESKMLKWFAENDIDQEKKRVILSGSGVSHFDRRFIRQWMPNAEQFMIYPHIDVGVVRRFLDMSGALPETEKPASKNHRALADAYLHLDEARRYRTLVRRGAGIDDA